MTRTTRALLVTLAGALPLAAAVVWLVHPPAAGGAVSAAGPDGVNEIRVRVYAWGFAPAVVHVAPGQPIRFVAETDDIKHGFAVNELGVNLQLRPGEPARSPTVTVALPEGTYTIHCSAFCGLGHPSMKGRLVVGRPPPPRARLAPWTASLLAVGVAALALVVGRGRRP